MNLFRCDRCKVEFEQNKGATILMLGTKPASHISRKIGACLGLSGYLYASQDLCGECADKAFGDKFRRVSEPPKPDAANRLLDELVELVAERVVEQAKEE